MIHGSLRSEGEAELLAWMRGNSRLAIRVTLTSFAFAGVVAFVLVIAQQVLQGGAAGRGRLLGLPIDFSPVTGSGHSLALLALALGAWMLLSSISRLIVARQVRDHLRTLRATAPAVDGADDLDMDAVDDSDESSGEGGDTMAERMLLESYLAILASAARTLAITVVLAVVLPPVAIPGLFLSWLVTALLAVRRYRTGQARMEGLRAAAANWRKEGTQDSHEQFVDAIYRRDTSMQRMTLGEALLMLGVVLLTVVLPAWFAAASSDTTSMVLLLIWLQGLLHVATESASMGWRWAHRQRLRDVASGRIPRDFGRSPATAAMTLLTDVPARWPRSEVVWLRVAPGAPAVVLLPGPDGDVAGVPVRRFAQHAWRLGLDLVVLRDQPFAGGESGYSGLGDDLPSAVAGLGRLVDLSEAVVLSCGEAVRPASRIAALWDVRRAIALDAPEGTGPIVCVPVARSTAPWTAAGRIDRLLGIWFDADRTDDDVADETRRLIESARERSPRG